MSTNRNVIYGIVAAVCLVAGLGAIDVYLLYHGVDDAAGSSPSPNVSVGGPFALQDGDGKTVTDQTYRGKWELVFFGYTFCPDVCPTTLSAVADALEKLGPLASQVQPLFITVDPKRDTPEVIGAYVKNFDPRIVGLTGSPEAVGAAAKQYQVYYAPQKTGDGPDDYLMDHSAALYLMNPQGGFVRIFGSNVTGDQLVDKLRPLLSPNS
jgi:protein SCO1/2